MFTAYSGTIESQMQAHYHSLPENLRRQYAAIESAKLGYGGKGYICRLFDINYLTLQKGCMELQFPELYVAPPVGKQRRSGGGRKKICV
jgi:hypothetical protein